MNCGPTPDLTGRRFGRLKVLRRASNDSRGHAYWRCHCGCGAGVVVRGRDLRAGRTTSCGCWHREIVGRLTAERCPRQQRGADGRYSQPRALT